MDDLEQLDDLRERENFVLTKVRSLISNGETAEEANGDEKFRSASRNFRQLFGVEDSERLVSCTFTCGCLIFPYLSFRLLLLLQSALEPRMDVHQRTFHLFLLFHSWQGNFYPFGAQRC